MKEGDDWVDSRKVFHSSKIRHPSVIDQNVDPSMELLSLVEEIEARLCIRDVQLETLATLTLNLLDVLRSSLTTAHITNDFETNLESLQGNLEAEA